MPPPPRETPAALHVLELVIRDGRSAGLAEFARVMTDEMTRDWLPVPHQISGLGDTYNLALMVLRKHLPVGFIPRVNTPYPILALPGQSTGVLIVPSRYWPRALVEAHHAAALRR